MMRLTASVAGPHDTRFFSTNAISLWLAAIWTAYLLYTVVGRRALYLAVAPTVAIYATLNLDQVAILVRAAVLVACVIGWVRSGEPVPRLERPPPERTDAPVGVPV
jgi:hypothetical protein